MTIEKQVAIDGEVWRTSSVPDWWLCRDGKQGCRKPAHWRTRAGKRRCADCMLAVRLAPVAVPEAAQ